MSNAGKFPIFPKTCTSLLSKFLTREVFDTLSAKQTVNGFTLQQAINSGIVNLDSGIGVYAGDEESYETFAPLFDPIIQEYHGFSKEDSHHSDFAPDALNAGNCR